MKLLNKRVIHYCDMQRDEYKFWNEDITLYLTLTFQKILSRDIKKYYPHILSLLI